MAEQKEPERGYDMARRALEEARANALAKGKAVGQGKASPKRAPSVSSRRRWSGSGPDARDPQAFGAVTASIAKRRGWTPHVAEGKVLGLWEEVVGADIADHATPTEIKDHILHITAESTAWATQLRLMQSTIIAKIAKSVGHGVVKQLRINGPQAPSWKFGEHHISGRGPRDTYG